MIFIKNLLIALFFTSLLIGINSFFIVNKNGQVIFNIAIITTTLFAILICIEYKNIKKRQKSTVPGFFEPISMAVMAGLSAATMAKQEMDRKKAAKAARAQQISAGEQEAAKSLATTGQGIMKADANLEGGGSVIDRPKLNVKKLLKR